MDREANTGGILGQTIDVIGGAGRAVALYVIVLGLFAGVGGLVGLVSADGSIFSADWIGGEWQTSSEYADAATAGFAGLFPIANLILYVVASYLLLRQMLIGMGRQIAPGSRFWVYLLMSILALLGMLVGFALLIVPGIILLVRWAAANGVAISRGAGITASLGESWRATSGHGLSIFFAGFLLTLALSILTVLAAVPFGLVLAQASTGEIGALSLQLGLLVALQSFAEALSNAALLALSIAVFVLVAPADEGVAEVFE